MILIFFQNFWGTFRPSPGLIFDSARKVGGAVEEIKRIANNSLNIQWNSLKIDIWVLHMLLNKLASKSIIFESWIVKEFCEQSKELWIDIWIFNEIPWKFIFGCSTVFLEIINEISKICGDYALSQWNLMFLTRVFFDWPGSLIRYL